MIFRASAGSVLGALLLLTGCRTALPQASQATALAPGTYATFNEFCLQYFGAEKEPLLYQTFGEQLKALDEGAWRYVSEQSACVCRGTNLPAKTFVEYGESRRYGHNTTEPERPFFLHVHYLRDLKPATTYHYRMVSVDERGNRHVSEDQVIQTRALADAVRIPDDLRGPPYVLDRPNSTYLVTEDLSADGTAIFIAASGITLDLGGHTITYDEQRDTSDEGACGLRGHKTRGIGLEKLTVVNGLVQRGSGGSETTRVWETIYNPIFFSKSSELEIAGVTAKDPVHDITLSGNRIFGTGYHPIGIGAGLATNVSVHDNYIEMQGTRPQGRWTGGQGAGDPAGQLHPVNGVRVQKGPQENVEYLNNTIVSKGRGEGCMLRGLWLIPQGAMRNVVFRDNVVKVIAEDNAATGYAIAALGADSNDPDEVVTYEGNTVISNICNVQFGDNYGHGGRHVFRRNTFARVGDDPRYKTIRLGWRGWKYETFGHVFADSEFEGGAGYDSVSFDGTRRGRYDFTVAWTLTVRTLPGAAVVIEDKDGAEVFSGTAGRDGAVRAVLSQYTCTSEGRTLATPHTVIVTKAGSEPVQTTVAVDRTQELQVRPGQ